MKSHFRNQYVCIALVIVGTSGCATQARLGQFKAFSEAGDAYQDTVSAVLDSYATSEIERSNAVMIEERPRLGTAPARCPSEEDDELSPRHCQLLAFDAELKQLAETLGQLRRHSQLLKKYFGALQALAAYDGDSKIGDSLKGTVDAIGKLSDSLKNAKIGNASVSDLAAPIGTMVVGAFRRSALEKELATNGARIDEALQVEEAVLRLVGDELANNQEQALKRSYVQNVVLPYGTSAALPSTWAASRKAYLLATSELQAIRSAADAAETLRVAFEALVEGRADVDYIAAVARETSEMLGLAVKIRGTPATPTTPPTP